MFADSQCVICSLEDVNAIKPGKVSSYGNFSGYVYFTWDYGMHKYLSC